MSNLSNLFNIVDKMRCDFENGKPTERSFIYRDSIGTGSNAKTEEKFTNSARTLKSDEDVLMK